MISVCAGWVGLGWVGLAWPGEVDVNVMLAGGRGVAMNASRSSRWRWSQLRGIEVALQPRRTFASHMTDTVSVIVRWDEAEARFTGTHWTLCSEQVKLAVCICQA